MDSGAPSFRTIVPHIIPILTSYKTKKGTKKLSSSVGDLYNWYYSLVENVNTESSSPELVALVKELTKDKKTDLERVKAIYYWTQENVKYIAFEYALGGFIPREANDVFRKKYGDCKDNSSILSEMLEIANLKGNLTWIGTRSIPYTYSEVPTPAVDNHMILSYTEGEKVYYLDATGRYTPIDMPSSFIQGKEALIGIGKNDFVVKKVPVVPAERNQISDSIYINIEGKKVIGKGKFVTNGYLKTDLFHALEKLTKQKDLKEFYTYQLRKGSNRFLIDDFKEANKFAYDKAYSVDYTFNIENYAQGYENEVYVNMNFNRDLSRLKEDDNRKSGKQFNYKSTNEMTSVLEIPSTMQLDYVPESFEISNDFFSCKIEYATKSNQVIYKLSVTQNFIELTLEEQKELNKMIKKIEKNYKEVVILKKK
ncbi:transglutaminase-like domain-containing protein [Aquimarina agarivorans]|uniref:transglutaminase-like domain-containing protein n=1 Tax=Aquimarina agarivorans TaxID=980584 RepID=UPI000B9A4B70|nr:transglutaminase-like domain-containing protein [Aquimarina agarivorans]